MVMMVIPLFHLHQRGKNNVCRANGLVLAHFRGRKMKIEKNSYLYKYLYWWNNGHTHRLPHDTCTLMSQLFWSVVVTTILSVVVILISWVVIAPIVYGIMWLFGLTINEFIRVSSGAGLGGWVAFALLVGIAYFHESVNRTKKESKTSELWRHIKDKTCGRIEYSKDEK